MSLSPTTCQALCTYSHVILPTTVQSGCIVLTIQMKLEKVKMMRMKYPIKNDEAENSRSNPASTAPLRVLERRLRPQEVLIPGISLPSGRGRDPPFSQCWGHRLD